MSEYFLEKEFVIDKSELFFEADDMLNFSKPVDDLCFRLPSEATLYINLGSVDYIEYPFGLFTFVTQQKSNHRPMHLVFLNPKEHVLQDLSNIARNHSTRFVCLKGGTLSVVGTPMSDYSESVLQKLIGVGKWVSTRDIMSLEKVQRSFQRNHQVLTALKKDGVVRTKKVGDGPGRPTSMYLPFWPKRAESWKIGDHIYSTQ